MMTSLFKFEFAESLDNDTLWNKRKDFIDRTDVFYTKFYDSIDCISFTQKLKIAKIKKKI